MDSNEPLIHIEGVDFITNHIMNFAVSLILLICMVLIVMIFYHGTLASKGVDHI